MFAELEDMRGTRNRAGMFNVERMEGRLEIRKNFWSMRVANKWNQLPDIVKSAKTVNCLKNGLDNWTEKSSSLPWRTLVKLADHSMKKGASTNIFDVIFMLLTAALIKYLKEDVLDSN